MNEYESLCVPKMVELGSFILKFKLELELVVLGLEMTANYSLKLKINPKEAGTNLAPLKNVVLEHLVSLLTWAVTKTWLHSHVLNSTYT